MACFLALSRVSALMPPPFTQRDICRKKEPFCDRYFKAVLALIIASQIPISIKSNSLKRRINFDQTFEYPFQTEGSVEALNDL